MLACEERAIAAGAQVEVELERDEAAHLLATGRYQPARGMYRGAHWRSERGHGCLHLRIRDGRAWLHWDRWDPRRHPIRHTIETPELAVGSSSAVMAGALALARLLGRV